MSPVMPRTPTIREELERTDADLHQWKLMLRQADSVERRIECRLQIGKCTQRIYNLRRELQEGY